MGLPCAWTAVWIPVKLEIAFILGLILGAWATLNICGILYVFSAHTVPLVRQWRIYRDDDGGVIYELGVFEKGKSK